VSPAVRRLPLRGADLVQLATPPRWKSTARSHNTCLVIECDGAIDAARVGLALDRFLDICPWPAARLRRPFPWGALHWAAGRRDELVRPPVEPISIAARHEIARALMTELNDGIDPEREAPLRIALVDSEPGQDPASHALVLTWFHPLMDARGGENLLAHLDHLDRHAGEVPWGGNPPVFVSEPDRRPLRQRGKIAGGSRAYMQTLAQDPPISPAGARQPTGRARFLRESFAAPTLDADARRAAREMSWRLALVGKAMAELWRERRLPDVPFLLPISVDLRRRGEAGATFGNMLAFHFARFKPSDTRDVRALARALRHQMTDAVRQGQIEANAVAMEFLRYCPRGQMLRALPWTKTGELFSFNFADLGQWPPALARCFGRHVLDAYHVPVVPLPPGVGVFFNRCGPRENVIVSWIEGVLNEVEAARIIEVIREALGWTRTT
jgi:hypothetical protein